MPIINAFGWSMITIDYNYSKKYWKLLSNHVKELHGEEEIKNPEIVQQTLKECFFNIG